MQAKIVKAVVLLAGAGLFAVYQHFQKPAEPGAPARAPSTQVQTANPGASTAQAVEQIRQASRNPDAKFWTTIQGKVVKLLKDDRDGSQHQRFLVEIAPDITLLVAHNIDLAPRIPVVQGDAVTIKGEYVWNNRGGVLHWTHHDPKGRKGGWVEVAGKRYE